MFIFICYSMYVQENSFCFTTTMISWKTEGGGEDRGDPPPHEGDFRTGAIFWLGQWCVCAKSLQSCPTLCDPMDYSPPGISVRGILQARIMEWVAIPSSRGSSQLRDGTHVLCLLHWRANSLPLAPPGTRGDCLYLGSPHDSTEMALFSSNSTGYANWCQEVF